MIYHPIFRRNTIFFLVAINFLLFLPSCDLLENIGKTPAEEAIKIIDKGINEISQNSQMWSYVLQRVAAQLPQDISSIIRNDAQRLATRSIATAGVEFQCLSDFLAQRAIESLQRLKAELTNQNPPGLPPTFCIVDTDNIDLGNLAPGWSTIKMYGYDLDQLDNLGNKLKVILVTENGETEILPENRIGRTTHYQIILDLGDMANKIYSEHIKKILVTWNGNSEGYPQIIVMTWEAKRETLSSVPMGQTGPYYPPRKRGDGDFNVHHDRAAKVEIAAKIQISENKIEGAVFFWVRELGGDHTEVQGWSNSALYTARPGWKIIDVYPKEGMDFWIDVSVQGDIDQYRPAGEVVKSFKIYIDRDGDEAGSWTRIITNWRELNILEEQLFPDLPRK